MKKLAFCAALLALLLCACRAKPMPQIVEEPDRGESQPAQQTTQTPEEPQEPADWELESQPATEEPATPEEPAIDAALVGKWFNQDGDGVLTIYASGGFELARGETLDYGELSYSEEERNQWIGGPHYDFYTEGHELLAYAVSLEEDGTLAFLEGAGAERYTHQAPSAQITVLWAEELEGDYDEALQDGGEYGVRVAFVTDRTVSQFQILALNFTGMDEHDRAVFEKETVYTRDLLTPERPLVVTLSFYGEIPNNGIRFTDQDGTERFLTLNQSGFDGSLELLEE